MFGKCIEIVSKPLIFTGITLLDCSSFNVSFVKAKETESGMKINAKFIVPDNRLMYLITSPICLITKEMAFFSVPYS